LRLGRDFFLRVAISRKNGHAPPPYDVLYRHATATATAAAAATETKTSFDICTG